MTDHPITPPPELAEEWIKTAPPQLGWNREKWIATQAAHWGADQELEACCEWLVKNDWKAVHQYLRAARRPKPPSLKEQALEVLERSCFVNQEDETTIRRALEQIDD